MSRTFIAREGLVVAIATLLVLTFAPVLASANGGKNVNRQTSATSAKMPAPEMVGSAQGILSGKCIKNRKTHVKMCIEGSYKYYRKVMINHHWKRKAFWGAQVYTQHCKKSGCYGALKEWRLPARWHYGKPIAASKVSTARRENGDCPPSLIGAVALCSVPWGWFNHEVDKVTQKVVTVAIDPCAKGSILGFGGVAATNLWTRIFFESGVMTAAKAASKFEGPEGYALAVAASCTVAVGYHGVQLVGNLFD